MIIKSLSNSGSDPILMHGVDISFRLPSFLAEDIGSKTIADILKLDAEILASKIKSHLETRKSIKSVTLASAYATVKFTAITPETNFVINKASTPASRVDVNYIVSTVDPDTGNESKPTNFNVSEEGWDNESCIWEVTFACNYYKAAYLMAISEGMKTKNPGGYFTLKSNFDSIGTLPYLAAPLSEKIIGYVKDSGFVFSHLYPIPGSNVTEVSVSSYPHLQNSIGADSIKVRLEALIVDHQQTDLTDVINQIKESELGHISGGLDFIYQISFAGHTIPLSERLAGHMLNQRQNLIWCFSELSRFFEMASVIDSANINRNMRVFQNKIKTVVDNELESALFPDSAPRDLEDLIIQLFPSSWKPIYKLIKQIDPNRILFSFQFVSGDQTKFNKLVGNMKYLSPGLILMVPFLKDRFEYEADENNSIIYGYGGCKFKLIPLTSHSSDVILYNDFETIKNNTDIYDDLIALVNIVFWLNIEESSSFLVDKATPGVVKVVTPTHLVRKYSQLPFFTGTLKARVLKGLI